MRSPYGPNWMIYTELAGGAPDSCDHGDGQQLELENGGQVWDSYSVLGAPLLASIAAPGNWWGTAIPIRIKDQVYDGRAG